MPAYPCLRNLDGRRRRDSTAPAEPVPAAGRGGRDGAGPGAAVGTGAAGPGARTRPGMASPRRQEPMATGRRLRCGRRRRWRTSPARSARPGPTRPARWRRPWRGPGRYGPVGTGPGSPGRSGSGLRSLIHGAGGGAFFSRAVSGVSAGHPVGPVRVRPSCGLPAQDAAVGRFGGPPAHSAGRTADFFRNALLRPADGRRRRPLISWIGRCLPDCSIHSRWARPAAVPAIGSSIAAMT